MPQRRARAGGGQARHRGRRRRGEVEFSEEFNRAQRAERARRPDRRPDRDPDDLRDGREAVPLGGLGAEGDRRRAAAASAARGEQAGACGRSLAHHRRRGVPERHHRRARARPTRPSPIEAGRADRETPRPTSRPSRSRATEPTEPIESNEPFEPIESSGVLRPQRERRIVVLGRDPFTAAVSHRRSSRRMSADGPDPSLPIAVFDSGVGGLTVLHECLVSLPEEDYLYLGDDARFPYGAKTDEELRECVERNTALPARPRHEADRDRLQLGRRRRARDGARDRRRARGRGGRGDRARGRDRRRDHRLGPGRGARDAGDGRRRRLPARARRASTASSTVTQVAAPDLAAIIQRGFPFSEEVVEKVRSYCAPLKRAEVDTVILGCTHYPLVRADAAAVPRPRGPPGHRRPRARRHRAAHPRGARPRDRERRARASTASSAPATRSASASSAPASCSCRSARSSGSSSLSGSRRRYP